MIFETVYWMISFDWIVGERRGTSCCGSFVRNSLTNFCLLLRRGSFLIVKF